MKRFLQIAIIILCFVGVPMVGGYIETHYTKVLTVSEVKDDLITVKNQWGNEWCFYGDEFKVGDVVKVTFFTNNTDHTNEDDEIVKVKKVK